VPSRWAHTGILRDNLLQRLPLERLQQQRPCGRQQRLGHLAVAAARARVRVNALVAAAELRAAAGRARQAQVHSQVRARDTALSTMRLLLTLLGCFRLADS
jgi:hypothetical protein